MPAVDKGPIRGIVLGKASDDRGTERKTDLIIQATAAEVAALTLGDAVSLAKRTGEPRRIYPNMTLYDEQGRPVALVTQYEVTMERYDVTSYGDSTGQFVNGMRNVSIRAVGLPSAEGW